MPNLEAAAALIADEPQLSATESVAETMAQAFGSVDDQVSESQPETPATPPASEPSPSELRAEEMRQRIERLKAQNAERAESKRLEALRTEIANARAEAERVANEAAQRRDLESKRWAEALKNPVAGFKELGLSPEDAYRQITEAVLENEKPEKVQAKLVEKLVAERLQEIEPKLSKVAELEEQLARFKAMEDQRTQAEMRAQNNVAEQQFLQIVKANGYETLADYYDDEELTQLGHAMANEFIAAKQPVTFEAVASELQRRLEAQLRRAEERRAQRTGAVNSEPPKAKSASQPASQAKTLTNQLASAPGSSTTKVMSRAERLARAEQLMNALYKD